VSEERDNREIVWRGKPLCRNKHPREPKELINAQVIFVYIYTSRDTYIKHKEAEDFV